MNDDDAPAAPRVRVRPYAITRGRTRPSTDVAIETLLVTTPRGLAELESRSDEEKRILNEAVKPVSLAEIAAKVNLMFGVARVIVGDLVSGEMLIARNGAAADRPDAKLLERVLDGLKSL